MRFGKTGKNSVYICIFEMIKKNIVYSTDSGRLCPECGEKVKYCICSHAPEKDSTLGPIFIEKQTAGRRGKPVNVIKNIPLRKVELKKLAKEIKKHLGVGGSCTDREIIIQGSNKEQLIDVLAKKGFPAK